MAAETNQAFRSAVLETPYSHQNVIVGLSGINYMDGSGLETLVNLHGSARTLKARVKFENLTVDV